ncbi:MAG: hypothetical protein IJF03_09415 [Lachnospiraceae bacterium]|nr:hypothetical protein [Lachnospiraceae bacterium]
MNKIKVSIWGREFELNITYDCYSDEEVLNSQEDAVKAFVKADESISISLDEVKKYCLAMNHKEIGSNVIENIFKYVVPKYLYVSREDEKRIVSIMCNYRFDQENGIAVVFENEKFAKIGKQDIIL